MKSSSLMRRVGTADGARRTGVSAEAAGPRSATARSCGTIMKLYAHHGFHEFVLCLGYSVATMIKEYFLKLRGE